MTRTPINIVERPDFQSRSIHVHREHPVELLASDDIPKRRDGRVSKTLGRLERQNAEHRGWRLGPGPGRDLCLRPLPRHTGINLANTQQGNRPLIEDDQADLETEKQAVAEAIRQRIPGNGTSPRAQAMTVLFSPTEFTEANEDETVALLTTIANVVDKEFPDVDLYTINHGTHQKPMPGRGVRFFDLPQFTPSNMGVKVHPLMFYDLERSAAGVYGNEDYKGLLSWTLEQQQHRRIIHYPESSWWLTFDLPVPLFLAPATVEARHHDINLLSPYLAKAEGQKTGIYGHRLFSSGREWGYWVIDYCASQMAWSVTFDNKDCWHDIAQALVDPRDVDAFETVMAAVETHDRSKTCATRTCCVFWWVRTTAPRPPHGRAFSFTPYRRPQARCWDTPQNRRRPFNQQPGPPGRNGSRLRNLGAKNRRAAPKPGNPGRGYDRGVPLRIRGRFGGLQPAGRPYGGCLQHRLESPGRLGFADRTRHSFHHACACPHHPRSCPGPRFDGASQGRHQKTGSQLSLSHLH